jgi:hypothetical protein
MRFDVYALARRELAVESFGKRAERPYLDAFEDLADKVSRARGDAGVPNDTKYEDVALTVTFYVGSKKQDGYYRPERAYELWLLLDPIYWALGSDGVITGKEALTQISVRLVRNSPREGIRIVVTPREPVADLASDGIAVLVREVPCD